MQKAILTIAFDDGYLDTYKYAISYLNKKGIKCTFAVPVGLIGKKCEKRPVVDWGYLNKMQKNGHDIASHGFSHEKLEIRNANPSTSSGFDPEFIEGSKFEITNSKQTLETKLNTEISSFVYPYISKLPKREIHDITKKFYSSSRISKNSPVFNKLPINNRYRLGGFCIMRKHSLSYLALQIDKAVDSKSWLIEVFHLVGKKNTKSVHRNKPYRFFMHIDDFKKHIDFVLSKNIRILTQNKVIGQYVNK